MLPPFLSIAKGFVSFLDERIEYAKQTHMVQTIYDEAMKPDYTRECMGDKRLRLLRRILDAYGPQWKRSEHQKMFHEGFIVACLPVIYGSDWETHSLRVLQEFRVTDTKYGVLCRTPRRFGKTIAVAMFVAALLLTIPGIKICVYSTGKRASSSLTSSTVRFVCKIQGGQRRIIRKNQEELFLAEKPLNFNVNRNDPTVNGILINKDTVSELHSYPAGGESKFLSIHFLIRGYFIYLFILYTFAS